MILTVERYMQITKDDQHGPFEIERALADAQSDLEEQLGRLLESAVRTEDLFVKNNGRVYPSVTPVTDAGTYTIDGNAIVVSDWFTPPIDFITGQPSSLEVEYTGGYTAATLPYTLEKAIAWMAFDALHPESEYPTGATAIRLGDASVTFASPVGDVRASVRKAVKKYGRRYV